jgi:hypothetical protein
MGGGRGGRGLRAGGGASFPSADFKGRRRGDSGNLSSSISLRSAAATAACSSSVRSLRGMVYHTLIQQPVLLAGGVEPGVVEKVP